MITTYLRRDLLLLPPAVTLMQRAEVLLAGQDETVASEQVLQLAYSSRCSAYDCEFVAAAQQLGVPLVTEDRAVLVASRMWRDPWSRGWNGQGHLAETIQ